MAVKKKRLMRKIMKKEYAKKILISNGQILISACVTYFYIPVSSIYRM